jgi:hypothetical protein
MSSVKNISLYIPHVFANFGKEDITTIMSKLGVVNNIDLVSRMGSDGKIYNAAYIHFDYWYENTFNSDLQQRVINPKKEARIMYDNPWYWIVLENKTKKFIPGNRKTKIDIEAFSTPNTPPLEIKKDNNYAPMKAAMKAPMKSQMKAVKLDFDTSTEEDEEIERFMEEMEEIEEENDKYITNIDVRYVKTIEDENIIMRNQLAYFQNLYWSETIKTQALTETIKKMTK